MAKTQIVFNHGPGTRSLSPTIKVQPGVNYVDPGEWQRLVDNDPRVRDLLAKGTNLGLTTKTLQTDALERIARGAPADVVVNALTADQGVLVVAAIDDDAALRTIQAKAKYPQVAQAALTKISKGSLLPKRSAKTAAPREEKVKSEEPATTPRNPAAKKRTPVRQPKKR